MPKIVVCKKCDSAHWEDRACPACNKKEIDSAQWWRLDFTGVDGNEQVRLQGDLLCLKTATKGFFSPELERYPSRQDLAVKKRVR